MIMKYVIVRRNVNCDDHLEKSVINIFVSKDRESTKNRNAFLRWCSWCSCLPSFSVIYMNLSITNMSICTHCTDIWVVCLTKTKLSVHPPSRGENYSVPSSRSIRRCLMFMKSPPRTDLAGMRNRYPPCLSVCLQTTILYPPKTTWPLPNINQHTYLSPLKERRNPMVGNGFHWIEWVTNAHDNRVIRNGWTATKWWI